MIAAIVVCLIWVLWWNLASYFPIVMGGGTETTLLGVIVHSYTVPSSLWVLFYRFPCKCIIYYL